MQELPFLHSARRLMLIDICMKFREDNLRGFQVTERTQFVTDRRTDGRTDARGKTICLPTLRGDIIHCLEVSCKEESNHQRAARVIYLRTTDRQSVNYYSTIHALEADLFRFEHTINDKITFEDFSFFELSAIALKKSRQKLDCFANVYTYLSRLSSVKTTIHRLTPLLTSLLITFQW